MKYLSFLLIVLCNGTFAQTRQYTPYIPQIPSQAYQIGLAKQRLYDERLARLKEMVASCSEYIEELTVDYPEKGKMANDYFIKSIDKLNTVIGQYDLTVNENYNSIRQYINQIKDYAKRMRSEGRKEEDESKKPLTRPLKTISKDNRLNKDLPSDPPTYSGYVATYSSAPIYDIPDMVYGKTIYNVPIDAKVKIIEKVKQNYYKVEINSITGYIHQGMIKPQ